MTAWGYARISTAEQSLTPQIAALARAGIAEAKIITDIASGSTAPGDRPGLGRLLRGLVAGDGLTVFKLDRLSRRLRGVLDLLELLERRKVRVVSLTEDVDTSHAAGRLNVHLVAALADFEAGRIRERTRAGLEEARGRGVIGGRPRGLESEQISLVRVHRAAGASVRELALLFHVSDATIRRALRNNEVYAGDPAEGPADAQP